MADAQRPPIFDGHNDTIQKLNPFGPPDLQRFLDGGVDGHLDLPRARQGGLTAGMFAVFAKPDPVPEDPLDPALRITDDGYEVRLAEPIDPDRALRSTLAQLSGLHRLAAMSGNQVRIVRTVDELEGCARDGALGIVIHLEGADAIDIDLHALDVLYAAGLRSLGPVWSRPNAFGHGVPFQFPASPDTGPGLTPAGIALVRRCNDLGILVDVSHLNAAGFRDVQRHSRAPIVATHSAAWTICRMTRNLTDEQLAAIRDSDGMVGANFEVSVNRVDGYDEADTPIEVLATMIEYLVSRVGIERVGFGSDFDGATIPRAIGDVRGLPVLTQALRAQGFNDVARSWLCWENWMRVLGRTWRES